jgi:hypothetical protein
MGQTMRLMTTVNRSVGYNQGSNAGRSRNPNGDGTNQGQSDGWSQSSNSNTTPIKVPFLSPEELYGMKTGYMVVISAGLSNAAPAFAPAYFKITTRELRARDNPYVHKVLPNPNARRKGMGEPTWDWGRPPPVQMPLKMLPNPARSPRTENIQPDVQARHPSYAPESRRST